MTEEHCEPAACRDSAGTPTGSSTRCSRLFAGAKYRGFLRLMCRMGMVLPFNVVTNAVTSAAENKHTHRLSLLQNAPTHACDHLQKHHAKSPSARARHLALYMWRGRAGRRPVSPRGDCPSDQSPQRRWTCPLPDAGCSQGELRFRIERQRRRVAAEVEIRTRTRTREEGLPR